ncbi:MAG: hypothetical protein EPN48_18060 [Microbacteriaceae bacterium]|nr:MAG: hypothetical protein EPN48_18060 [Microbacteriaceae bacterium]
MGYEFPVEPGRIYSFSRAVGDDEAVFESQTLAAAAGAPLVTSPTFVQSSEHYDPARIIPFDQDPESAGFGGGSDMLHAEQHFEYFRQFKVGDRISVESTPGSTWFKDGRSGRLEFIETLTEYRGSDGEIVVRARKVSVHKLGPAD